MTEQKNQTANTTKDTDNPEERKTLRERADLMGIKYSPNISNEKLRERIKAIQNDEEDPGEGNDQEENFLTEAEDVDGKPVTLDDVDLDAAIQRVITRMGRPNPTGNRLTKKQLEQREREKQWAEQLKLVRVRITCHNPLKKDLKGEVISVTNKFVGTVRKFIPYEGYQDGYHIPQILLTELQRREYQSIKSVKKDRNGLVNLPEWKLVKEYSIELLEPLTKRDIDAIARQQLMASGE